MFSKLSRVSAFSMDGSMASKSCSSVRLIFRRLNIEEALTYCIICINYGSIRYVVNVWFFI